MEVDGRYPPRLRIVRIKDEPFWTTSEEMQCLHFTRSLLGSFVHPHRCKSWTGYQKRRTTPPGIMLCKGWRWDGVRACNHPPQSLKSCVFTVAAPPTRRRPRRPLICWIHRIYKVMEFWIRDITGIFEFAPEFITWNRYFKLFERWNAFYVL